MPTSALAKITAIKESMKKRFIRRNDEIDAIWNALILGQHVLFTGIPGTAKSDVVMAAFSYLKDASTFKVQLRKEMTSDHVFGPLNMKSFREDGEIVYNTKGMLPWCSVAFLDEMFDANDGVLRGMLECLNERSFSNGAHKHSIPLRTVVATSNFFKSSGAMEAVTDRFLYRIQVDPLDSASDKRALLEARLNGDTVDVLERVSVEELESLQEHVGSVQISGSMLNALSSMTHAYITERKKGYSVSDRRMVWMLPVLRLSALQNERESVNLSDLNSLHAVFCLQHQEADDAIFFKVLQDTVTLYEGIEKEERLLATYLSDVSKCSEDLKLLKKTQAGYDSALAISNHLRIVRKNVLSTMRYKANIDKVSVLLAQAEDMTAKFIKSVAEKVENRIASAEPETPESVTQSLLDQIRSRVVGGDTVSKGVWE